MSARQFFGAPKYDRKLALQIPVCEDSTQPKMNKKTGTHDVHRIEMKCLIAAIPVRYPWYLVNYKIFLVSAYRYRNAQSGSCNFHLDKNKYSSV